MIYLFAIFFLGVLNTIQTAANSRLRQSVASPLVASLVSFSVGTVFLLAATFIERGSFLFSPSLFSELPLWAWMGGLCGVYALTVNILIFPKLGSMQTVLLPMIGQISMGLIIDHFGLLHTSVHQFSWLRAVSVLLIFAGVLLVIIRKGETTKRGKGILMWQIIGFSAGVIYAMQPPMNSLLAANLSSAIYSALFTFVVATVILIAVILCSPSDRVHIPQIFSLDRPWWSWLGGIIGGIFVTGYAFFADKVSIGALLVTSICGMLAMSLCIDKYGWLGAVKREVGLRQYTGLLLIAAGVVLLRLF